MGLVCRTFRMKNVQKFQPGIDCWPSDRLTSSSLEEMAVSNADKIPSFTFESSSAQAAGLSLATGQASCTHLQTICNTLIKRSRQYAPVSFICIEVSSYLVEHIPLHLEEIRRCITSVRPEDVYNDPFLALAMIQGRLPVFDLLFGSSLVRVAVLRGDV